MIQEEIGILYTRDPKTARAEGYDRFTYKAEYAIGPHVFDRTVYCQNSAEFTSLMIHWNTRDKNWKYYVSR